MINLGKHKNPVIVFFLLIVLLLQGGIYADDTASFTSRLWPEGQRMFYSDTLWRGGDCASTVDLGDGRVLWLFADSYIGIKPPYERIPCCVDMIRNCVGIQHGYDPSTADFRVYWRGIDENPGAYFPSEDSSWFWPGNGVLIDGYLVVFVMQVCASDVGLSFTNCGQAAFLIDSLDNDPRGWHVSPLELPENNFGILLGAALFIEPPFLYIFSIREPGDHSMYLSRWHTDSLLAGRFEAVEWWTGERIGWITNKELVSEPEMIYSNGATEFSVVYSERSNQYLAIQTVGFGGADVMMRAAPTLTGPWSDRRLIFHPSEKGIPEIMIYAAKAHPEIVGADLILTYMTNSSMQMIIEDSTIYYPRFIRLDWKD